MSSDDNKADPAVCEALRAWRNERGLTVRDAAQMAAISSSHWGEIEMRKTDHQLQQPLYIANWAKQNGKDVKYDQENTGYGWKIEQKIDSYVAAQPTSCSMKRPS